MASQEVDVTIEQLQPQDDDDTSADVGVSNAAFQEEEDETPVSEITPSTSFGMTEFDTGAAATATAAAADTQVYDVMEDDDVDAGAEGEIEEEVGPPTYDEVISSAYPQIQPQRTRPTLWQRFSRRRRLPDIGAEAETELDQQRRPPPSRRRRPWKLDYVDFVKPVLTGTSNSPKFMTLLERANAWLLANPGVQVIRCETVTWFSADKGHFRVTNATHIKRVLGSRKVTHYKRGVRLWYIPLENGVQFSLGLYDYAPPFCKKKSKSMTSLLDGLNAQLMTDPVPGEVLSVETVFAPLKLREPSYNTRTRWVETMTAYTRRRYVYFIRIYYTAGSSNCKDEIGFHDILPCLNVSSPETFNTVSDRACQWVATQADFKVINLQSIFVKVRSARCTEAEVMRSLASRYYDEPPLRASGTFGYFVQICRVAYTKSKNEVRITLDNPLILQQITVSPEVVPRSSRLEGFKRTVARASTFLNQLPPGSDAFCVETLMIRPAYKSQTPACLGADQAYLKYCQRPGEETWEVFARLYYRTHVNDWGGRSSWGSIRALHPKQTKRRCVCLCRLFITASVILGISLILMLLYLLLTIIYKMDVLAYAWDYIRNITPVDI